MFKAATALAVLLAADAALARQFDPALQRLREDVSAVLGQGADQRLLLIEEDHGVSNTRSVAIGEEYAGGWRLEAVGAGSATLRKGDQAQTVPLDGPRMAAAASPPAGGIRFSGPLVTSNAVEGPRTPQQDLASIAQAVSRGDLREVARLGGSAADAAQALAVTSDNPDRAPVPETAQFVNAGGRVALAGPNAEGNMMVISSEAMSGFGSAEGLPSLGEAVGIPNIPAPPGVIGEGAIRLTIRRPASED